MKDAGVSQEASHKALSIITSQLEDLSFGGNGHIIFGLSGLTAGVSDYAFLELQ